MKLTFKNRNDYTFRSLDKHASYYFRGSLYIKMGDNTALELAEDGKWLPVFISCPSDLVTRVIIDSISVIVQDD